MAIQFTLILIAVLVLFSAIFAMFETALTASNRHRINALANQGNKAAQKTVWLLDRLDQLLSVILITNTLINALLTTLITALAISLFGSGDWVLSASTMIAGFILIVFTEITPKYLAATFPERIAVPASHFLRPYTRLALPVTWFVNLFVRLLLYLMRIKINATTTQTVVSSEELRNLLQVSNSPAHYQFLLNTLELEKARVGDLMKNRSQIEAIDITQPIQVLREQISTAHHNSLLVYEQDWHQVLGILHVRKAIRLLLEPDTSANDLRSLISPAYFVPPHAYAQTQLAHFQAAQVRLGIVVDEYGTVLGLITVDDILEEIVGQFTTSIRQLQKSRLAWDENGSCVVDAHNSIRTLNKRLGIKLPTQKGRTLNGLILASLRDLPESAVSLKIAGVVLEVLQVMPQGIKTVKIFRPTLDEQDNLSDN